jgi:GDPmannose 4,6-dehydratase
MWRMLQQENPEDFLIATGDTQRLQDFVACAFDSAGLDWMDYVVKDASLMRPSDLTSSNANPEKAQRLLGWSAETFMPRLVEKMMNEDL